MAFVSWYFVGSSSLLMFLQLCFRIHPSLIAPFVIYFRLNIFALLVLGCSLCKGLMVLCFYISIPYLYANSVNEHSGQMHTTHMPFSACPNKDPLIKKCFLNSML